MRLERGPIGDHQHKHGNAALGEVLLLAKILIGGDKKIEVGVLRSDE